jgi:hypothetical protein
LEQKTAVTDEVGLRNEFFECAAEVDWTWHTHPERRGAAIELADLSAYPLMRTYFGGIRYIGGFRTASVGSTCRATAVPTTQASRSKR